jgi:hypothetical protein
MNATYWYYAITREESDTTGFRFHGQFAHARYQAYNVYNDVTKNLVWAGIDSTQISALSDVAIVPDPGSNNPFLLAVPRDTPNRDYTVWVVPEGADTSGLTNVITFPTSVTLLSIFLRVYLPDENTGLSGGVPLPTIESFDTATGSPAPCLPTRNIFAEISDGDGTTAPNPGANTDGQVRFYRLGGGGFYPNEDSAYLATIFKEIGDSVAVIRLKPPTYTDTSDPAGILPAQAMTRYWSFNVYSIKLTNVTACLADYKAVVAPDGFVYVVVGRRSPELLARTEGMNFLPWGAHDEILFVYRNITPNAQFPYSAAAVPVYSADETAPAENFIGEYAPIGVYTTEEQFLGEPDPLALFERVAVALA